MDWKVCTQETGGSDGTGSTDVCMKRFKEELAGNSSLRRGVAVTHYIEDMITSSWMVG